MQSSSVYKRKINYDDVTHSRTTDTLEKEETGPSEPSEDPQNLQDTQRSLVGAIRTDRTWSSWPSQVQLFGLSANQQEAEV